MMDFKNKKIAFIASGGGGKGIAHCGVLKACEDLGIKFNFMAGASAGAILIAYYAQTGKADDVLDLFRSYKERKNNKSFGWRNMISFKNFFSSEIKTGLIDMTGAEEFLRNSFDINDFNSLSIPIYISATNLQTCVGEIFGPGFKEDVPVSKTVVASCCVPLIFRPVKIGDSYYIDGEIKRPTAVNNAFELGADVVIVSDIYKPYVSGIEKSNMFNIAGQMTNMLLEDKSMRGIKIAQNRFPDKQIFLVSPDTGNMSSFDTYSYKKLERLGYNAAMKVLQGL